MKSRMLRLHPLADSTSANVSVCPRRSADAALGSFDCPCSRIDSNPAYRGETSIPRCPPPNVCRGSNVLVACAGSHAAPSFLSPALFTVVLERRFSREVSHIDLTDASARYSLRKNMVAQRQSCLCAGIPMYSKDRFEGTKHLDIQSGAKRHVATRQPIVEFKGFHWIQWIPMIQSPLFIIAYQWIDLCPPTPH